MAEEERMVSRDIRRILRHHDAVGYSWYSRKRQIDGTALYGRRFVGR